MAPFLKSNLLFAFAIVAGLACPAVTAANTARPPSMSPLWNQQQEPWRTPPGQMRTARRPKLQYTYQDGNPLKCTPPEPEGESPADFSGGTLYDATGAPVTTEAQRAQVMNNYSEQVTPTGITLGLVYVRYCREPSAERRRELHAKYQIAGQRINAYQGWSIVFVTGADVRRTAVLAKQLSREPDIYETRLRSPLWIEGL